MFTREELSKLSDFLSGCADKFSDAAMTSIPLDDANELYDIACELWSMSIDAVNAHNAHITEDNGWIWNGESHWPSWWKRSSMHFVLDCACGKSFANMMEIDAINDYFSHLEEA